MLSFCVQDTHSASFTAPITSLCDAEGQPKFKRNSCDGNKLSFDDLPLRREDISSS